jgi:mannose-6-phosphate isomerase-like protein (cupin superfamily)
MADETEFAGVRIYRAADAPGLVEAQCMKMAEITEVQRNGLRAMVEAGYLHGDDIRILVDLPGFSLTHAWLKKDYPLILHSHDTDCLYFIVSGSLRLGTMDLGPRDCFFVPANTPYTYRPGSPNGVEVLEFRHEGQFNFVNLAKSAAYWAKATETVAANVEDWKVSERPPLNV